MANVHVAAHFLSWRFHLGVLQGATCRAVNLGSFIHLRPSSVAHRDRKILTQSGPELREGSRDARVLMLAKLEASGR